MPFAATVYRVLIASPSDVKAEREAISGVLHEWSAVRGAKRNVILMPVMWETHSAPSMADRPQGVINNQMVKACDMLIGVFWTRLGSPTGKEDSGTIEEIKYFLDQKRPVMLYFSSKLISPDDIDHDQHKKLKEFKSSVKDKGILGSYTTIDDLKSKLMHQIDIIMDEMETSPTVDRKAVRDAAKLAKSGANPKKIPDDMYLEDYTEKSFIIRGNTKEYKEQISDAGGKWISIRQGGHAWMFSKKHAKKVSDLLGIQEKLQPRT